MFRLYASLLFLSVAATFAQTPVAKDPAVAPKQALVFPIPAPSIGCPIGFSASRQGGLHAMTVDEAKKLGPGQGLHLTLAHPSKPDIQSIEVTVYATSLKPRALLLEDSSPDMISRTFTLERQTGEASLGEADVWMNQVGSVRWADLIAVTFTNGVTWRPTADLKCQAFPSNFLLVETATATRNGK
jgi:hypothetical protein